MGDLASSWRAFVARLERESSQEWLSLARRSFAVERTALEHDYRYGSDRLVRQRRPISSYWRPSWRPRSRSPRSCTAPPRPCARRLGSIGRAVAPPCGAARRKRVRPARRTLAWQKALAGALEQVPDIPACPGRPGRLPLLVSYLAEKTGTPLANAPCAAGLESLDYLCRRPTWTVAPQGGGATRLPPKKAGVEALT